MNTPEVVPLGETMQLSHVGADTSGQAVLATLHAEDVDVSAVGVDAERATGLLLRDCHATRAIDVQYHRAGSALSAAYVREAVVEFLELARAEGAVISFDPNVRRKLGSAERWREVVGPLPPLADLVFTGTDELELVSGMTADELLRGQRTPWSSTRGQERGGRDPRRTLAAGDPRADRARRRRSIGEP